MPNYKTLKLNQMKKPNAYMTCIFIDTKDQKIRVELVFKKAPISQGEGKRLIDINGENIEFEGERKALVYLQERGWTIVGIPRYKADTPNKIFRVNLMKEITSNDQIEEGLSLADNRY